ncbi:gliding motility lipoprotein GldD [Saccharicrinis sp. FJH2]|uniref:gliding motility lipoprotein GldD n=1 Tax=Saccharicrinis sp. FJH65 TaxID=3344659 RepID=UPI0035F4FC28
MRRTKISIFILLLLTVMASCKDNPVPRQRGILRIDVPSDHVYKETTVPSLFSFESSDYASVTDPKKKGSGTWLNINYPEWKGRIYLTYFTLNDTSLQPLTEDARRFAYKHAVLATSIDESVFGFADKNVYGMLYDIGGNAASAVQFFATDSTNNFLLGSLYFNAVPDRDSLNPVINYVRQDVLHLIETLNWEN